MSVLYYHRMLEGFPKPLYQSVSYAAGYSKRSFVLTTPDRNDHVLIDPSEGMDLSFPELALLNEQGLGPKPNHVHVVHFDHDLDWKTNLSRNQSVIEQLRHADIDILYPFTGKSQIAHSLAEELEMPVRASPRETAYWAEDKKTLLDLEQLAPVPRGYKVWSNEELLAGWHDLLQHAAFPGKAVIKASQAASGVTSSIIKTEEHLRNFIDVFDLAELEGGVIEEWHDSDPRSPSINYFIYPDGTIKVLFISDQIFEDHDADYGEEGTRIHRGNRFPSTFPAAIREKIRQLTRPLAETLYAHGYWGPVGFDTIITNNSDIFITEINPRITGPHFGWRPMKNLGLSFFALQNEKVKKNTPFAALQNALQDVLYEPGRPEGYIMLNFFPGKFIGVVVASYETGIEVVQKKIASILKPLRS